MNLDLARITAECCVGMLAADYFGTRLVSAIGAGRARLAGWCDVGGDFFGKVLLTGYGLASLTHGHGIAGWACTAPVLATGYWTTKKTTQAAGPDKTEALVAWARTQGFDGGTR